MEDGELKTIILYEICISLNFSVSTSNNFISDSFAKSLIQFLNVTKVCLGLKMIRVATRKHRNWLNKFRNEMGFISGNKLSFNHRYIIILYILLIYLLDSKDLVALIYRLKSNPQARCTKKQKISTWISRQCNHSEIINMLN